MGDLLLSYVVNGVRLSREDGIRLKNSAKVAQSIEDKYDLLFRQTINFYASKNADQISSGSEITIPPFEEMFVNHYFQTQIAAFTLAEKESELKTKRLARKPRSLADVLRQYDLWRKGLFKPKSPLRHAKDLKDKYIGAVQKAWHKYSEEFRNGGEQTQQEIRNEVKKAAKTTTARAQTIVRTETTRYYNQARRTYYDKGDEVTHYLFLAVRDKATTVWCTSKTVNGKRGRSGLVYAKDDPLLDKETPPCHWNCRSELLPLNRFNPAHLRLIGDKAIARRSHTCAPLPTEWNK